VKHKPTDADIRQYFWSLVDKNGPLPDPATGVKSKCWLWLGSVTDQGYGRFKAGGKELESFQPARVTSVTTKGVLPVADS
jgi:hypothetical protein